MHVALLHVWAGAWLLAVVAAGAHLLSGRLISKQRVLIEVSQLWQHGYHFVFSTIHTTEYELTPAGRR